MIDRSQSNGPKSGSAGDNGPKWGSPAPGKRPDGGQAEAAFDALDVLGEELVEPEELDEEPEDDDPESPEDDPPEVPEESEEEEDESDEDSVLPGLSVLVVDVLRESVR